MYIPKNLHVILVAVTLLISAAAVEVRVLTGLNMRGQVNQPDYDQKVVLNSNNRFIYPSQQVPEYNVFNINHLFYNRNFLEVVSNTYLYPLLIIEKRQNKMTSYQLVHPLTRQIMDQVNEPIYLKPIQKMQFVIEEQPFNIMSFLFSGTGLFLFGGVFLYMCYKQVLPKLEEAQMAPEGNQ